MIASSSIVSCAALYLLALSLVVIALFSRALRSSAHSLNAAHRRTLTRRSAMSNSKVEIKDLSGGVTTFSVPFMRGGFVPCVP